MNTLFHSLQVAFYPSFWLIVNTPVVILTPLYDEIHSKMDELEAYESELNVDEIHLMGSSTLRMIS